MVEQESLAELRRSWIKTPGTGALSDCVPGPHCVRIDPVHQLGGDTNPTLTARQPYPVFLREAERLPSRPVDEQPIVAEDLPQPGILRMPRMVHLHRPLSQRVERKAPTIDPSFLERR